MSEGLKLEDRRDRIMEILNQTGKVRVAELSQTFGTSEVTKRIPGKNSGWCCSNHEKLL